MLHRIRLAMKNGSLKKLGGSGRPVEVDETFIGGEMKNMHPDRKLRYTKRGGPFGKAIVMGLLDRDSRQVRAKVVPNVKKETLQGEILKHVVPVGTVYTDQHWGYDNLAAKRFIHETVNHMEKYVDGQVHTQGIETFGRF
jgi:transposase-like protein